jgi:hypothetical protein
MAIDIKTLNYNKYCAHCRYLKKYQGYCQELFHSKYFDTQAQLSLPDVLRKYDVKTPVQSVYNCLKRHHAQYAKPEQRAVTRLGINIQTELQATESLLEQPNGITTNHELGLDEFIDMGRRKVAAGEIAITGQTYLTAIKVKADIEKTNKDRKLDMLKTMFAGAAPEVPEGDSGEAV